MLRIYKKGNKNFWHEADGYTEPYSASDLTLIFEGNTLKVRSVAGRIIFDKDGYLFNQVTVYNVTGTPETFSSVEALEQRLIDLGHPAFGDFAGNDSISLGYINNSFTVSTSFPSVESSNTDIINAINTQGFTVNAGFLNVLKVSCIASYNNLLYRAAKYYKFNQNNVLGAWGNGNENGSITFSDLTIDYVDYLIPISSGVLYISLGDIGSETIDDYLENFVGTIPELTDNIMPNDGKTFYFEAIQDDVTNVYEYTGTLPKTIGVSTFETTDFDLISTGGETVYTPPLEETVIGTALYDGNISGTYDLDLSTFSDFYGILTSNTVLTVSNTPAVGKSFVRNAIFKSSTTETLDLPNTWNINGDIDTTGVENNFTIKFSNFPTVGLIVTCDIWQNE